MKNLYVVAHAQSQHHIERRVGGWYDTPLTEFGVVQAGLIAQRLRELIPHGASTELKRAYQTAEAIAAVLHLPIEASTGLREKSYGEAEGKPQSWLDERLIHASAEGNRMDHDGGIAGSETRRVFAGRIYRTMDRIMSSPCEHQIVVTHGGALTFVVAAWTKIPIDATGHIAVRSTSGGISHLQEDDVFHDRRIMSLNETAHLAPEGASRGG